MPLPNTGMTFTPFDPLPASDLNDLVENIEALADGSGLDNASVGPSALNTGAVQSSLIGASTTTSTSYTPTLADGLTLSITATVGNNGILLVGMFATMQSSVPTYVNMSFALSGANTLAANDNRAISTPGAGFYTFGSSFLMTGLNPGSTTITAQYSTLSGTATFNNRRLYAIPL